MKSFIIILLALFTLNHNIFAEDNSSTDTTDNDILGSDFVIDLNAEINASANASNNSNLNTPLKLEESFISLSATWKQKIRAVITGKLEHIFNENNVEFNNNFNLQEFIKEAYIEIREVGGLPIAVIVGKQPIAFGQNIQAMPIFNNNPLSNLQEIDQVYGVTVELTEGLFGLFDQVELSIFETKGGDLELGKIDGLSVRLSKFLTEQWLLTVSHTELGNNHLNSGHERRTSVGIIGENKDGTLVGWVEGMYFSNNPKYPNSNFSITVGGQYKVHSSTDIVLEYSYVQKAIHDLGLGVKTNLTKNMTVGAEIRYRNYVEQNSHEVIFGLNFTYYFGLREDGPNERYLFGDGGNDDDEDFFDDEFEVE